MEERCNKNVYSESVMKKPKVFIGSSSEALPIAKALEFHLSSSCDIYIWNSGVFNLSQSVLEDLDKKAGEFEYAVLVLAPDDWLNSRGKNVPVPRDNVLFELGLFVGRIGRRRTFVACDPEKVKLLTAKALENGLIILSCGIYANTVRMLVPLTVPDVQLEEGLDILEQTLTEIA